MKTIRVFLVLFILTIVALVAQSNKETKSKRTVVPLSKPNQPVHLTVSLMHGNITVKGSAVNEVIVETADSIRGHEEELGAELEDIGTEVEEESDKEEAAKKEAKAKKIAGMKKIADFSTHLTIEEENNQIEIRSDSFQKTVDLTLYVPVQTSVKLATHVAGDIHIENLKGDFDITNTNGAINAVKISGSMVANSINGEILVIFDSIASDKPSSFSNFNGDIDVTIPANIKATLKMTSNMGDIYSDFDVKTVPDSEKDTPATRDKKGRYQINFNKGMMGLINGGGQEIKFNTFNGSIYIRKSK